MATFALNAHRAALLASCITIGMEGAEQNHVDTGGENTTEDLQAIAALLEELDAIAGAGGSAEVTVMRTDERDAGKVDDGRYERAYANMTDRQEREHERRALGG